MKNTILPLIVGLLCSSCTKVLIGSFGQKTVDRYVKVLEKDNKTIVFIPNIHVASADFYASVKKTIDSLRTNGYTIAYEGFRDEPGLSQAQQDTLLLKIRKVLRRNPTGNYLDSNDASLPKHFEKLKGIPQTHDNTGIRLNEDYNIDISTGVWIQRYEQEKGEIRLTDCDFNTPLTTLYECEQDPNSSKHLLTTTIRNNYIIERIVATKKSKIAILFGAGHWYGLYPDLLREGYQLTQGKINPYR